MIFAHFIAFHLTFFHKPPKNSEAEHYSFIWPKIDVVLLFPALGFETFNTEEENYSLIKNKIPSFIIIVYSYFTMMQSNHLHLFLGKQQISLNTCFMLLLNSFTSIIIQYLQFHFYNLL